MIPVVYLENLKMNLSMEKGEKFTVENEQEARVLIMMNSRRKEGRRQKRR
jgi:hypothetical protein